MWYTNHLDAEDHAGGGPETEVRLGLALVLVHVWLCTCMITLQTPICMTSTIIYTRHGN